jgi:hypothetical protein
MKISVAGFFAGLVIFAALTVPAGPAAGAPVPAGAEEYEILSKLVAAEYGSDYELILLNERTEQWCINSPLGVLFKQWPGLKQETIDSLIVGNSGEAAVFERKFDILAAYALISEQEFIAALRDTANPNWDNFDSTFTDAQGLLTFSKIGFEAARSQALVIFSNAYRCSGTSISPADRKIAFFNKTGGSWKLVGIARGFRAR